MVGMIVGAAVSGSGLPARAACSIMAEALRPWCPGAHAAVGTDDLAVAAVAGTAAEQQGRAIARSVDGTLLLASSMRIDNLCELANALGVPVGPARSAAELLLLAWQRWGPALLEQVAGDGVAAIAHTGSRELWLLRTPLALRSLFFRAAANRTLFASHPDALHAVPGAPKVIDLDHARLRLGQFSLLGRSTMFGGVERVRPGEIVHICSGEVRSIALWKPERRQAEYSSLAEAGEALRYTFDEVVRSQLPDGVGQVAAYLSGGRDSSAVATAAALALAGSGKRLQAYTGAPPVGFADPSPAAWQADESATAAMTSSRYLNIDHRVIRPESGASLRWLRRLNRLHHQPITNFSNTHWWIDINNAARAAGATVMLSGAVGNFTISAGPLDHLSDLMSEDGLLAALRAAGRSGRLSGSVRAILSPRLPRVFDDAALLLAGRRVHPPVVPILAGSHRTVVEHALAREVQAMRPWRSGFDLRSTRLLSDDASDPFFPAVWGMEQRDPTADRRLIDLCFSMPSRYLVPRRNDPRPLYRAAFGDRVPEEIVLGVPRGVQGADWFVQFDRQAVQTAFARLMTNPINRELLEADQVNTLLRNWPSSGFADPGVDYLYPCLLLNALSVADFIDLHWPA